MEQPEATHSVILADNQIIFRAGAARILSQASDMRIALECDTAECLLQRLPLHPGSILLLAHTLPIDLHDISERAHAIQCPILLLIENGEKLTPQVRCAVDSVAARSIPGDRLLECVRSMARGEPCYEAPVEAPEEADTAGLRVLSLLTPRELQVIGLVIQGLKNREVAADLNTHEQVVKNYLRSVYDKTGVSDRLELALFILHHRILVEAASRAVGPPRPRR